MGAGFFPLYNSADRGPDFHVVKDGEGCRKQGQEWIGPWGAGVFS